MDDAAARAFRGKDWAILESERLGSLGERITFVTQTEPLGFGHAVLQAKEFVGDEPFVLLLGDHVYISEVKDRCVLQLIRTFEKFGLDALTGVQPTIEKLLYLFGTIKGRPYDIDKGIFEAELIIEKPAVAVARERLVTPGLPAGNYLTHFGIHVFGPGIFGAIQHLIDHDVKEKNEYQFTSAQEHLRADGAKYWTQIVQGQRYDTGIPYGLMETQLALALHGQHRAEICEAIARILAMQVKE